MINSTLVITGIILLGLLGLLVWWIMTMMKKPIATTLYRPLLTFGNSKTPSGVTASPMVPATSSSAGCQYNSGSSMTCNCSGGGVKTSLPVYYVYKPETSTMMASSKPVCPNLGWKTTSMPYDSYALSKGGYAQNYGTSSVPMALPSLSTVCTSTSPPVSAAPPCLAAPPLMSQPCATTSMTASCPLTTPMYACAASSAPVLSTPAMFEASAPNYSSCGGSVQPSVPREWLKSDLAVGVL